MFDLTNVDMNFEEKYNAEFEGFDYYKKGWYIRKEGNLIEIKLHAVDRANYEILIEEEK